MRKEFVILVNRFFTPFAVLLIVSALVFVRFEEHVQRLAILLLILSVVINYGTAWLVKKKEKWSKAIGSFRLSINLVFNVLFMYFLGSFWGPLWILFLLTPLATGLYASFKTTLIVSVSVACLLLVVYGLRGMHGVVGWGQTGVHAVFIVCISMFVHTLSKLARQ